jgi:para-aminobenzoate synthetase/4-amino-4-deoxychorismate lyase
MEKALSVELDFYLFETLVGSRYGGLRFLDRHLARLAESARTFDFEYDPEAIRSAALQCGADLPHEPPHRIRIRLERSGAFMVQCFPLQPPPSRTVKLLFGADWDFAPQHSSNPMLLHKSSLRDEYDRGWQFAESKGAFDLLFINERGELTEGGRTNLFLRLENRWWTPPLTSGVLPGIMRSILLEAIDFDANEKVLFPKDLFQAEEILLCNSLRGAMKAELIAKQPH